jgi:hypothetical protein
VTRLPPRGEWTSEELGEIDRIRAMCVKRSGLELECSHTNEGDPWCVVYDQTRGRILLHIARIDRCYIVVSLLEGRAQLGMTAVGHPTETLLACG